MLDVLPKNEAGLQITHNEHKTYYQTVLGQAEHEDADVCDWVSEEEWAKAIESNEMWEILWYPYTPVGSRRIKASTLQALLDYFLVHK